MRAACLALGVSAPRYPSRENLGGLLQSLAPPPPPAANRHQVAKGYEIEATPILGGLRHRYRLKNVASPESAPNFSVASASAQGAVSPENDLRLVRTPSHASGCRDCHPLTAHEPR